MGMMSFRVAEEDRLAGQVRIENTTEKNPDVPILAKSGASESSRKKANKKSNDKVMEYVSERLANARSGS